MVIFTSCEKWHNNKWQWFLMLVLKHLKLFMGSLFLPPCNIYFCTFSAFCSCWNFWRAAISRPAGAFTQCMCSFESALRAAVRVHKKSFFCSEHIIITSHMHGGVENFERKLTKIIQTNIMLVAYQYPYWNKCIVVYIWKPYIIFSILWHK